MPRDMVTEVGMATPTLAQDRDVPAHVIWHFGFIKTGSSFIQNTLRANRKEAFAPFGVVARGKKSFELRQAANRYAEQGTDKTADRLRNAVQALLSDPKLVGHPTALVSDENLAGYAPFSEHGTATELASRVLPVIDAATAEMGVATQDYVAYTRDYHAWLKSCHNQMAA